MQCCHTNAFYQNIQLKIQYYGKILFPYGYIRTLQRKVLAHTSKTYSMNPYERNKKYGPKDGRILCIDHMGFEPTINRRRNITELLTNTYPKTKIIYI